ncbi:protein EFR3 homolog B-like [Centruroides sculpturatus]|nr:protein EFR3 homolog B-like [Centruroides sculpturatus]
MAQTFSSAFLQPLLQMSLAPDPAVRLVVQQILHTLLDRHDNLPNLLEPCVIEPFPQLNVEKCSRQDSMFMKKVCPEILLHIYENIQLGNNSKENFSALYTTLALLCIELGSEEALIELLRITFALQELPSTNTSMSSAQRIAIHHIVAGFLYLIGHLTAIPALCTHIDQVSSCFSFIEVNSSYS